MTQSSLDDLESTDDIVTALNQRNAGWAAAMQLRFVEASDDAFVVEWTVAEPHLQPYGIVHGGVHCGVIETVCSMAASISARKRGHVGGVVGLENHTSFVRAVGVGAVLRARATPITRGRTTHVWEAKITDEKERVIARGTVRLLCVTPDQIAKTT
jgi:1,4-dihydroxy-2-naphthoyl-CoA hydrolase